MDWCNPGCCCILGNSKHVNYLWYLFPELVSKVKFSTVMSDFHQKLSRIGRLKYKTSVFFFKSFIDNSQEVCYSKVYEIVLNGGFFA